LARVSVGIAAYNNRDIIGGCLVSVFAQTMTPQEVVVVDNASTDGTAEFVAAEFPEARLIINDTNELFTGAQNTCINDTDGEFYLMLNSDVVLDGGFLEAAVGAMDRDAEVGSVTGRVLRTGGGTIDTTGLFVGRDRRPAERGYGEPDDGRYSEPGYVFGAGGVCPLYRRSMLSGLALGKGEFLDSSYGAFYEDLDLAWRAARSGWKAYYEPRAAAFHMRGATARKPDEGGLLSNYGLARLPVELQARLVVNRYMTIIKNDSFGGLLLDLPFVLLYEIKLWAYLVLFSPGALAGIFRGLRNNIGRALRLRGEIHARK
jgi:GT2 family glycosyltransferase